MRHGCVSCFKESTVLLQNHSHFQTKRKSISAKNISVIVHPVWILTFEIAQMKMLILRLKIRILKRNFLMRRLNKRNKFLILSQSRHSFLCLSEVQSSHSILSKLLEKVLPKRTFLIPTDTIVTKGEYVSRIIPETAFFKRCQDQMVFYAYDWDCHYTWWNLWHLCWFRQWSWMRYLCLQYVG